ncbi:hypothetical protein H5158_13290 [Pseudoalteromonas sp. SR45-6]|uniref:hypothetical protein n=1 Tax=Pseudoalteromonas sp. SR45-6 TaxID=2760927 RepID=UPI001601E78D|nr:hypothetical protein [Pseudoalteromonas sp. SR45-6]MBB1342607.1 hypothetical protein [Pseudoalteromonas sp. SR45-6]
MAQAVTVYRWDDEGAPQIVNGMNRDVLNVLDKCLVEGYGTKQALGWVKTHSGDASNPRAAYSNVGGSGNYLVISSKNGTNDDSGLHVRSAHSVPSLDSLYREGYTQSIRVFERNKYWMIIGTEKAFYFFSAFEGTYNEKSYYTASFFAGDISNSQGNDTGRFICFASSIDKQELNPPTNDTDKYGENLEYMCSISRARLASDLALKIWDADGEEHVVEYAIEKPYEGLSSSSLNGMPNVNIALPFYVYFKNGESTSDRVGTPCIYSTLQPYIRGTLPGLISTKIAYDKTLDYPATINMPDQPHYLLRNSVGYSPSNIMLATESWDD